MVHMGLIGEKLSLFITNFHTISVCPSEVDNFPYLSFFHHTGQYHVLLVIIVCYLVYPSQLTCVTLGSFAREAPQLLSLLTIPREAFVQSVISARKERLNRNLAQLERFHRR